MKIVVDIPETALCGVITYLDVSTEGFHLQSNGITPDEVTKARSEEKMAGIELQAMRNSANWYKAEYEKEKAEIERLEALSKHHQTLINMLNEGIAEARAEAISEFAERLKAKHRRITDYDEAGFGCQIFIVEENIIDKIEKEMGCLE